MELILDDPVKYLGFTPMKIGRWWNNQEEIDLVAIGKEKAAFIECKWQSQKVGHKVLLELLRKAELVEIDPTLAKVMVVFSKSGFKEGVEKAEGKFISFT